MASAGDPFTWTPDSIPPNPITPQFAIVETQSSGFKRQIQLIDSNKIERYELDFGEIPASDSPTDVNRDDIYAHYIAQNHSYSKFYWNSVPSYIADTPFYVRYDEYKETPMADGEIWKVFLVFRKEV